jgi:hypothetical protein
VLLCNEMLNFAGICPQLKAIERVLCLFEQFHPELASQRYSFLYECGLLSFTLRPLSRALPPASEAWLTEIAR